MSVEFLRQVAATPLPKSFVASDDVDAVKILRQAGLLIAVPDELPPGAVKVVAITEKGNEELLRFHHLGPRAPDPASRPSWLRLAARRARSVVHGTGRVDNRF